MSGASDHSFLRDPAAEGIVYLVLILVLVLVLVLVGTYVGLHTLAEEPDQIFTKRAVVLDWR